MSNQVNKLINLIKNTKLGRSLRRGGRRGRKRRRKYTAVPQISGQPQRLGIGTTVARITREISVTQNSNTSVELMSLVTDSYEFTRQSEDYNFFRLKCINVIQHPINVTDVNGKVWLYMDWLNDENINTSTMGTWDNAKMLSYNAVKPITYTFLPPNARLRYQNRDDELINSDLPINFTEWIPAREMVAKNVPGWLKFMNVGNKDLSITVDAVLEFKGAKGYDSTLSKASRFIHVGPITEIVAKNKINEKKEEEKEDVINEIKMKEEEEDDKEEKKRVKKEKKDMKKLRIKEYQDKVRDLSD